MLSAFDPLLTLPATDFNDPQLPVHNRHHALSLLHWPLPHQVICDSYADCARINGGHARNSCQPKTVPNGTTTATMKMCACMIYAGVTNTSCVLEAKCVTGPNACLVRGPGNQARPISFSFALSASLSLFSTISLPHNRSDWSLTHYLTLMSSLSASLPFSLSDGYFNLVLVFAQLIFLTIPMFVYAMVVVRASTWSCAKLNAASTTTIFTALGTLLDVM